MNLLMDLLDAFNWFDRLEGVFSRIVHADYQKAGRKSGAGGVAVELGRAIVGDNAWTFRVSRDCDWSGADIERFLGKYGIVIWGRRITSDQLIFSVKERQANWAEYLLMRRGIPLAGRTFNQANVGYGQEYAPGDAPPAWADRPRPTRRSRWS